MIVFKAEARSLASFLLLHYLCRLMKCEEYWLLPDAAGATLEETTSSEGSILREMQDGTLPISDVPREHRREYMGKILVEKVCT